MVLTPPHYIVPQLEDEAVIPLQQREPEKLVSAELVGDQDLRSLRFSAVFILLLSALVWVLAVLGAIQIVTSFFGAS